MHEFIVDNDGIYVTRPEYGENISTIIMPRETFIEAYNKYIRDDTSSNSNKEVIG